MGRKAGALLWNRMRIDIPDGETDFDTGLTQGNRSFPDYSLNEPPLGVNGVVEPPDGALPASRIQVIPLAPTSKWATVTHGEPYFNTVTGTIHVVFYSGETGVTNLNVLFWNPHSLVGPGLAATYNSGG